jgi:hypothetical protein
MTSKEFILWLQGFTQGIEEYTITPTPTQWNVIKAKLAEVNDGQPIGVGGLGVPNTQPFPRWQEPHTYVYTGDPIPCVTPNGTVPSPYFVTPSTPGITFSTTPGSGIGTITTPNGMSTSTTYGYPSGSAWSYTSTQQEPTPPKSEKQLLTDNID